MAKKKTSTKAATPRKVAKKKKVAKKEPGRLNNMAGEKDVDIDALTEHERKHWRQVESCEREVAELETAHEAAKAVASKAKKAYDAGVEELRTMIRRGPDPQQRLPGMEPGAGGIGGGDPQSGEVAPLPGQKSLPGVADDGDWRNAPTSEMELPKPVLKKLSEAGINTMGQLADWTRDHGEFWHQDIPGIGEKAAETIGDATVKFYANRKPAEEPGEPEKANEKLGAANGKPAEEPVDDPKPNEKPEQPSEAA